MAGIGWALRFTIPTARRRRRLGFPAYGKQGLGKAVRDRTWVRLRSRRPSVRPRSGPAASRRRIGRSIFDLRIDLAGLPGLRTSVATRAGQLGAGEARDDVVLVAHELATNVVRHGGGFGRLRLWRAGSRIVCRVSDSGTGLGPTSDGPPPPGTPGGRGLWIARRLADVRIETGPSGTVVFAAMPL